jgi:hypothetical protein
MTESKTKDALAVNEKGIPFFNSRSDSTPIRATAAELVALEHDILDESDLIRAGYPVHAKPLSGVDELVTTGAVKPALDTSYQTRSL